MATVRITIADSPSDDGKIDVLTRWEPGIEDKHPSDRTPAQLAAHRVYEWLTDRPWFWPPLPEDKA